MTEPRDYTHITNWNQSAANGTVRSVTIAAPAGVTFRPVASDTTTTAQVATRTPARSLTRENLQRSAPFALIRAAADDGNGDGLSLEGLAAVFDTPTVIDSWEGRFREQLARGAFRKTLQERTPKLQFDHGSHPLIGSLPIGRITEAKETQEGLRVKGRLSDSWLFEPVRDAISAGDIDGMSFRFSVIREQWADEKGKIMKPEEVLQRLFLGDEEWDKPEDQLMTRTIKEVSCAELGPVVFPAYTETSVGVRSLTIDLGRINRPGERSKLAQAIFAADQRAAEPDIDETPVSEVAAPPAVDAEHPGTTDAAAPPANAEHPAVPDETRAQVAVSHMDAVLNRIHERNRNGSR